MAIQTRTPPTKQVAKAPKLSPAKVAALSKNPGTRTKVPTAQLAPKYQKMRKANTAAKAKAGAPAKLNPLDDPSALTAPLTPRLLEQQVKAQSALYAGPAAQDLSGQLKQSQQMSDTNIPAWFQQYQAALQHATDQTKAAYATAAAVSQNAAQSSSALDQQAGAQQQQNLQQQAALSGGQVDPKIAAMAEQASASRRSAADAQTNLTAGLGAAQEGYRAGQQTVGAAQEVSAQAAESKRADAIHQKISDLAAKTGEFATTTRQKLIDAEHTKQIENKAFGLNVLREQDNAAAATARDKTARQNNQNSAATSRQNNVTTANTSRQNALLAAQTRASEGAANRRAQSIQKQKDRIAAKERASIIATNGVSPADQRRRNTTIAAAEDQKGKAVASAKTAVGFLKTHPLPPGNTLTTAQSVRRGLETAYPNAPKQVIDYALASALGSKAGVTKKGQLDASGRYRLYLKNIANGTINK